MNTISKKYFPEFKQSFIEVEENIKINTLVAGEGEAILLLHGHPESHLMWRGIASKLAKKYKVVLTDLRGYAYSSKPEGLEDHSNYSKRVMAKDQVRVMEKLGIDKFHIISHDRGARVAHRLILDYEIKVLTCTLMDILPTYDMYNKPIKSLQLNTGIGFFIFKKNLFQKLFLVLTLNIL